MKANKVCINPKNYYKPSTTGGPVLDADALAEVLDLESLTATLTKQWNEDFDDFVKNLLEAIFEDDDANLRFDDGETIVFSWDEGDCSVTFNFKPIVDDLVASIEDGTETPAKWVTSLRAAADRIEAAIQQAEEIE